MSFWKSLWNIDVLLRGGGFTVYFFWMLQKNNIHCLVRQQDLPFPLLIIRKASSWNAPLIMNHMLAHSHLAIWCVIILPRPQRCCGVPASPPVYYLPRCVVLVGRGNDWWVVAMMTHRNALCVVVHWTVCRWINFPWKHRSTQHGGGTFFAF